MKMVVACAAVWMAIAANAARAAEPLSVVNAAIRQMENGAPLPQGFTYTPGEILFFSFQVAGYEAADDKVHISYEIDAVDPKGVRIMEPIKGDIEATLAPQDKNWKPKVHPEIPLPPLAGSGTYKFVVHVTDDIGKKEASTELPFAVRGHEVEASDTLVLRNFRFFRSEEEPNPLANPVFRRGDAVWARFDITGYKFGDGNMVEVAYGIAVLNADGKVLYSQDQAAIEQGGSFYPKRYVPGQMSITTQSNMRPGDYYIVVKVEDRVGGQKYEAKEKFTVE
jgi:hypothetical protein